MKRLPLLVVILLLICIFTTSCKLTDMLPMEAKQEAYSPAGSRDDIMDNGPVRRGTLNLGSTTPDTLNPIYTSNIYVQNFSKLIFEGLVKVDKNQKPVPCLAKKWEVSPDGLIWTFQIRDNITWQDNMPLTSEDIEFTINAILNPALNSVYKKNVENISSYAASDRNTIKLVLKKPDSFTAELMTFPIIAKHYFVNEDIANSSRNMQPMGTGPYKFMGYKEKSEIRLSMNDKWWNSKDTETTGPDLPYIYDINVKIYDSIKSIKDAFQKKEVDVLNAQPGDFSKYSGRGDIITRKYAGNNFEFIAFNLSRAALSDKAARQAIAEAIDKAEISSDFLPGGGVPADIPIIPDTWFYDANIQNYTPNPSKAKERLEQNGWKQNGEVMYKIVNGYYATLDFEMLVNKDNPIRCKAAQQIANHLGAAGIRLKIKEVSWDEQMSMIKNRNFDMAFMGCTIPSIPDISFLYSSSEIASGRNISGYSNPDVDSYLEQIKNENDSSTKKAKFLNLKAIITDEVPYVGLYFYNNAVFYNKKLRGSMSPNSWDMLSDATRWYIPVD